MHRIEIVLLLIPAFQAAVGKESICIRDKNEVKDKINWIMPMDTLSAAGYEDTHFLTLIEGSVVFIDKSLLIKKILETKEKVVVITSPLLTGKSINLSMLKAFFEIRLEKLTPSVYPRNQTSTYMFFTTGHLNTRTDSPLQTLFSNWEGFDFDDLTKFATYTKPPMIADYGDLLENHMGRYPVIYLQFNAYGLNVSEHLRTEMCDMFKKHELLLKMLEEASKSDSRAGERFKNFLFYRNKCTTGRLDFEDLENGVLMLSQVMSEHFGEPVILLMDGFITSHQDYIFLTNYSVPRKNREESAKMQVTLLRNFLRKSLAENRYLKKAVITGTISAHRKEIFADISDIVHYNVVDNDLQEFYGFTEKEVQSLFHQFKIPSAKRALNFYKGYRMKPNTNLVMYNSWSVANFVNEKQAKPYWENHEMFDELKNWLNVGKLADVWKSLVSGDDVLISFVELDFHMTELLYAEVPEYSDREKDCVLSLLYEMGFLTYSRDDEKNSKNESLYVRAASEEMRHAFKKLLEDMLV